MVFSAENFADTRRFDGVLKRIRYKVLWIVQLSKWGFRFDDVIYENVPFICMIDFIWYLLCFVMENCWISLI